MIALDTSALVAIALGEADCETFEERLLTDRNVALGCATLLETRLVLTGRLGATDATAILTLLVDPSWYLVPFDFAHIAAATDAMQRYGKGRHPAALNFGDCMAYAVAKVADCPLLYKGDDFAQTDIHSAL